MKLKTAIITGASTGIGKAIAQKLAKTGFRVLLIARSSGKLKQIVKEIESEGGQAEYYKVDLSNEQDIKGFLKEVENNIKAGNYSQIDALLNIAGVWHDKKQVFAGTDFEKFDDNVIKNTYAVGFTAPTLLAHGLIPFMKKACHIINISGTFENGAKGWLPYYASKKGLEELTYGLGEELKHKGICVNGISPSDTATEEYSKWFPDCIEDAIDPKEIAKLVVDIISSNKTGTIQVIKKYDYSKEDVQFVKHAIVLAKKSLKKGMFPSGALLVCNGKIISEHLATPYPKSNLHSDSKCIDEAMNILNKPLNQCTLYSSMEPCLMCLSRAYWSGLKRIVFATKKESLPYVLCYESNLNNYSLLEKFNSKIEMIHIKELESEILPLFEQWQKVML